MAELGKEIGAPAPLPGAPSSPWGMVRAFVIGIVLCIVLDVLAVRSYAIYDRYSGFADHFNTIGVIFLIFWLTIFSLIAWALKPVFALSGKELAVVYAMLMIATAIPTMGFGGYVFPLIAGVYYYGSPENAWPDVLWPTLPRWIAPKDPQVIRQLFEGMPQGASVPWGDWFSPMFFWGTFFAAFFMVSVSAVSIMYEQWAERERLPFPLAVLPITLTDTLDHPIGSMFTKRLFWVGLAVSCFFPLYNFAIQFWNLSGVLDYYPLSRYVVLPRLWVGTYVKIDFLVMGLCYLVNLDVLLGVWVFHLVGLLEQGFFNMFALESGLPKMPHSAGGLLLANQQSGALIFFVVASLWVARRYLWGVVRDAWLGKRTDGSLLSPRAAIICGMLGLVYMAGFLHCTGLSMGWSIGFLVVAMIFFFGTTRLLVQVGYGGLRAPFAPASFMVSTFGTETFGATGLQGLGLTFTWGGDVQLFIMGTAVHALRVCKHKLPSPRIILAAMVVALVVGLGATFFSYIWFGYHRGLYHGFVWYFVNSVNYHWGWVTSCIRTPQNPQKMGILFMVIGMVAAALCSLAHYRLPFWPVHPAGMAIAMTNTVWIGWFSVFLTWGLKTMIIKYGGLNFYQKLLPLFIGFILGSCLGIGTTAVIGSFYYY
jgi:hypothetical protein